MLRATVVFLALLGVCLGHSWEAYKQTHGKVYGNREDVMRHKIFRNTVKKINSHNVKFDLGLTSYRMGLNKFTDMTNQEFRMYKGRAFNATKPSQHMETIVGDLPASVDWRPKGYVTAVKDQGQCGSCWAFSATGSLEGQHFAKTGKLVSLSEQNLVDCSGKYGNEGCDGGLEDQGFDYIKDNGGIDTEESYPYTAQDGDCRYNKAGNGATVTGFKTINAGDENALKKAVATIGPISVGIDASQDSFQSYESGVYDEPNCSTTDLDHSVLAVGYGTQNGKDFWIVKNSWGGDWGLEGYILMSRNNNNQCGIASEASYPLV